MANPTGRELFLAHVAIEDFRSIRSTAVPLGPLTIIAGRNGAGKSNVVAAIRRFSQAARNLLSWSVMITKLDKMALLPSHYLESGSQAFSAQAVTSSQNRSCAEYAFVNNLSYVRQCIPQGLLGKRSTILPPSPPRRILMA